MNHSVRSGKLRYAAILAGLFLPSLLLLPLGSIWLWQNGYLVHWAAATLICVAVTSLLQRWLLKSVSPQQTALEVAASWTPAEEAAWKAVCEVAERADAAQLSSRDACIELGLRTVRAVAHSMHPEVNNPLWQFTVPEAFALLEQVSGRLRGYSAENVPFGDQLTVAQILSVYRWRGALDVVERIYDVWRLARLANPVTAAANELRERFSKQLLVLGREHIADRLMEAYVKEVGRAAIDLYSGRLRVSAHPRKAVDNVVSNEVEPVRIIVVGRRGAGKSSIVRALRGVLKFDEPIDKSSKNAVEYKVVQRNGNSCVVVDSPALMGTAGMPATVIKKTLDCDMVVLAVSAQHAERGIERDAIKAFQELYGALPRRRRPPIVIALTHLDLVDDNPPKLAAANMASIPEAMVAVEDAGSVRRLIDIVAADLKFDDELIVPVTSVVGEGSNVDGLWLALLAHWEQAKHAKSARSVSKRAGSWSLTKLWSQARRGSGVVGKALWR